MRFMANSRIADGVPREQLVQFFEENTFSPAAWDLVRRRTVSRPAGVADTDTTIDRLILQYARQAFVDFAFFLWDYQVGIDDGNAGTVVAAIFEPPQSLKENWRRRFLTDIADNSTHSIRLTVCLT